MTQDEGREGNFRGSRFDAVAEKVEELLVVEDPWQGWLPQLRLPQGTNWLRQAR